MKGSYFDFLDDLNFLSRQNEKQKLRKEQENRRDERKKKNLEKQRRRDAGESDVSSDEEDSG